ncbi:kinase-like domain-containing protein [Mycena belliarum]|uniref:Kinase-like domain-containing protein n=1 Tax=Mycena belliarum TaxID=1033014 RepID=A0AAD6U996_9AGAR|nr:kinase-like domain-containing protein [Mycena belliae]
MATSSPLDSTAVPIPHTYFRDDSDPQSLPFLYPRERFWVEHQSWLEQQGYRLRPRYQPDWRPSWLGTATKHWDCEDARLRQLAPVMDAVCISDGTPVVLKVINTAKHPDEVEIGSFFMAEPLVSDPANHCRALRTVLQLPKETNQVILVMPLLRRLDRPRFDTIGEIVALFEQLFEGLQFMHKHRVAHRDCTFQNILMDGDPLFSDPWRPIHQGLARDFSRRLKHRMRTARSVNYHLIDFGLSRKYTADQCPPVEPIIFGIDRTVPEFQTIDGEKPFYADPFPTDVYYLGNMIREHFLTHHIRGLEFMWPLVQDMVQNEPRGRPTMDEVVKRFEGIRKQLSYWKLRSRAVRDSDIPSVEFFRGFAHFGRRIRYMLTGVPPIPMTARTE